MTTHLGKILQLVLIAIIWISAPAEALSGNCDRPAHLRFSLVPQGDIKQDIANLQPLFRNIEQTLHMPVHVITPSSYGAVVEGLLSGTVDLARLGPASYVAAKREDPSIVPFASYARAADIFQQESASYYALLLVRAGSTSGDIASLRGKTVALVDPDSTSGAVIPGHMMQRETGMPMKAFFGRIVYSGSHEKSIGLVLSGDVDAAFVSSSHVSTLVESGKIQLSDIKLLWRSDLIPRDPFVFRGRLCKDIQDGIKAVFLKQMNQSDQALLKNLNAIYFIRVEDSDYQIIRDAYHP